jgi:hypothetical protein
MSEKSLGPDEEYCTSCGEPIKKEAEICPECGVSHNPGNTSIPDESGIVSDKTGRIISWFTGAFLIIGGFATFGDYREAAPFYILTGAFVTPPIRDKLEEALDYTFPRWAVVLSVFIGLFVAGSMMSSDGSTQIDSGADLEGSEEPAQETSSSANLEGSGVTNEEETQGPSTNTVVKEEVRSVSSNYISEIRGISFENAGNGTEEEGKTLVVNATIADGFFEDDYLYLANGASSIFQKGFPASEDIQGIGIAFYKTEPNQYGNVQRERIGLAGMTRSTYQRINWDNFEEENLQEVAQVRFEGDSTYYDLKESQEDLRRSEDRLERFQNNYDYYDESQDTYQNYGDSY